MALTQASEEGLKISNAGTNGQFLQKQSGNTGGLTWATVDTSTLMPLAGGTFTGDVTFDNQSTGGRDIIWDESDDALEFLDNTKATFGNDGDLKIYHNGTDNYIMPSNGKLIINNGSETLAQFTSNGAVELYYDNVKKFETTTSGAKVNGTLLGIRAAEGEAATIELISDEGDDHADNWRITASDDHAFYLQNYAGGGWETNIKAAGNGAVWLNYDNVTRLETTSSGVTIPGGQYLQVKHDSGKITFGADDDMEAYHNGSHGYIKNTTGTFHIQNDRCKLVTASEGDVMLDATSNGSVELYHSNSKKLETTSTGITVTGNVAVASGNGIDFSATGDGNETDTSELFDDYEEGTWVPTLPNSGSASVATLGYARYTKTGRMVTWEVRLQFQASASNYSIPDNGDTFQIGGLPYNPDGYGGGVVTYGDGSDLSESNSISVLVWSGNPRIYFHFLTTDQTAPTNNWARGKWSGKYIILSGWYTT